MNSKLTSQVVQSHLMQSCFDQQSSSAEGCARPSKETAMIVTLDQLRPYEFNPRVMRNPNYDDIKASIRQRGLDTPPPITRRPDQDYYIIANGGNTRLSILNELWQETHDERFWRIHCLYRPWGGTSKQLMHGELRCLIGHLAENDLHGKLSFIERALGISKARELYQHVEQYQLSQRELAERLRKDGYPINQSQISRMEQTLEYLHPYIPQVLYAGLGRPQIEKLLSMRTAALRIWEQHATDDLGSFENIFSSALSLFNDQPEEFCFELVQDELLGLLSQALNVDYNLLMLDLDPSEQKRLALLGPTQESPLYIQKGASAARSTVYRRKPSSKRKTVLSAPDSPLGSTLMCESNDPIMDIWCISPLIDSTQALQALRNQVARELAECCGIDGKIFPDNNVDDADYKLSAITTAPDVYSQTQARACRALLMTLNGVPLTADLAATLDPILLIRREQNRFVFSDQFLIKAFRLIRIVRRLMELQQDAKNDTND